MFSWVTDFIPEWSSFLPEERQPVGVFIDKLRFWTYMYNMHCIFFVNCPNSSLLSFFLSRCVCLMTNENTFAPFWWNVSFVFKPSIQWNLSWKWCLNRDRSRRLLLVWWRDGLDPWGPGLIHRLLVALTRCSAAAFVYRRRVISGETRVLR